MRYTVFVQHRPDGSYQGSVPMMPGVTEVASTREAVIEALERAVRAALETAEFASIDVPGHTAAPANPWLTTAGSFAADDSLEPLLREIYTAREADER
jgi:predicted RNase H-like HicB family nuclease